MCPAIHTTDLDARLVEGTRSALEPNVAVEMFSRALLIQPDCTCALVLRGNVYFNIQEYEYAFVDYDQAIQINRAGEAAAIAYNNRGTVHAVAHRLAPAIRDFGMAIDIAPTSFATAYHNRSIAGARTGDYSRSRADADKALVIAPYSVELLHQRAEIAIDTGDYDTAIDYYTRSLAVDATDAYGYNAYAYLHRGYANRSLGRQSDAAADFQRAIAIAPHLENEDLRRFMKSRERGSGCFWIVALVIFVFVVIATVQWCNSTIDGSV